MKSTQPIVLLTMTDIPRQKFGSFLSARECDICAFRIDTQSHAEIGIDVFLTTQTIFVKTANICALTRKGAWVLVSQHLSLEEALPRLKQHANACKMSVFREMVAVRPCDIEMVSVVSELGEYTVSISLHGGDAVHFPSVPSSLEATKIVDELSS